MKSVPVVLYTWAVESTLLPNCNMKAKMMLASGCFVSAVGSTTIFIEKNLKKTLSEQELNALMLHEQAHVELEHLKEGVVMNPKNSMEMELQADKHAVFHGADPTALLSGIDKVFDHCYLCLVPGGGFIGKVFRSLAVWAAKQSKEYKARRAALLSYAA